MLPLELPFQYKNLLHFFTSFNCGKLWGDYTPKAFSEEAANIVYHPIASESEGGMVSYNAADYHF